MAVLLSWKLARIALAVVTSVGIGLAVIVSTYYVDNYKLVIGLVGGTALVLLTMRWPEFGILSLVALLSGLISVSWLPVLPLGPVSLNISDILIMILLALVFLRATTQPSFGLYSSPLVLPLFLFIGAILLSAANAIVVHHVGFNIVLRTVRMLALWIVFVPTLQLVRDEKALRRLLTGLLVFTGLLLIGILFPNKFEPLLAVEERAAGTGAAAYSDLTRLYFAGDVVLYSMIPVTVASLATLKHGKQLWRISLLGLLLFWAFRTQFRNYWLTLGVGCLLLLGFLSATERMRLVRRMAPAAVVGALLVGMLVVSQPKAVEQVTYVVTDRVGSLLRDPVKREGSLQWRVIETRYALQQITRNPLLGVGLGNSYRPPMVSEAETMYSGWANRYVENGYLYVAVMMGLVGLLPFLWLCTAYLLRVFRYHHEIRDEGLRAVYLGFGIAILGMMVGNIVNPLLVFGTRLIFFPVAMATSEVILRLEREKLGNSMASQIDRSLADAGEVR